MKSALSRRFKFIIGRAALCINDCKILPLAHFKVRVYDTLKLRERTHYNAELVQEYAGTHYTWDERGNLTERATNDKVERFIWDI